MKSSFLILISLCIGCGYGPPTLHFELSESQYILEFPEKNTEAIEKKAIEGVTYIPQFIVLQRNGVVKACVRAYSNSPSHVADIQGYTLTNISSSMLAAIPSAPSVQTVYETYPSGLLKFSVTCFYTFEISLFEKSIEKSREILVSFQVKDSNQNLHNLVFNVEAMHVRRYGGI